MVYVAIYIPSHYVVFQKDSNRHGGGVLILLRSSIPAMERSDLETNYELLWIQISSLKGLDLLLFIILPLQMFLLWRN